MSETARMLRLLHISHCFFCGKIVTKNNRVYVKKDYVAGYYELVLACRQCAQKEGFR